MTRRTSLAVTKKNTGKVSITMSGEGPVEGIDKGSKGKVLV